MPTDPDDAVSFPASWEWEIAPDLSVVPPSRRLVAEIARCWRIPLGDETLRDVELCAGEVIANAVEHAGGRCRVTLRWSGERLRLEVADACLAPPDPGRPPETATGGRGLFLIEHLSDAWGWRCEAAGKTVWFEFAQAPPGGGDPLDESRLARVA